MELPLSERSCGDCDVCCNILEVKELEKEGYTNCIHKMQVFFNGGCSIYNERPMSCKEWSCCYILGLIPNDRKYKPNNLGLMFYPVSAKNNDLNMSMYMAQEVWPKAIEGKIAQELISLFKIKMLTLIRHYNSNNFTYVGPPDQVKEFEKRHVEYMSKQSPVEL